MKYAKAGLAIVATALTGIVAALSDGNVTDIEWINVAIVATGAAGVFAAPNVPGAKYTKSILAALSAALVFLSSAITDGIVTAEWLQIAVVVLGALGVWAVPNTGSGVRAVPGPAPYRD